MRAHPAAALFATLALACAAPRPRDVAAAPPGAPLAHVVLFWLKPDAPPQTAGAMQAFYAERVPGVRGVRSVLAGPPAGTPRDVVDNTYSLLSIVLFEDATAQAAWQTDPVHDELKARFLPHVERVVVYDALP